MYRCDSVAAATIAESRISPRDALRSAEWIEGGLPLRQSDVFLLAHLPVREAADLDPARRA
jgi:hypothetical protein